MVPQTPTDPAMADYSFSLDTLKQRARDLGPVYRSAQPFPHIYIDDFFAPEAVEAALAEFPDKDKIRWQQFNAPQEVKLASRDERTMGSAARRLIWEMHSQPFIEFLEELTGIQGLVADPHLSGGGLHQILRGGKLGVHIDFNKQPKLRLDRRLNLLLYLNKDWKEEYGGHLELWNKDMTRCEKRILPIFNRVALFSTSEGSYHGHPDPLQCPEGWSRKSIALYYYTNGRPEEEQAGEHSTVFRSRPGEVLEKQRTPLRATDFVPPIVTRAVKRMLGRS
ncbi:MAG: hypothetical protein RL398_1926 [Planctomycetota bacterium]